ncbi:MAG TPA: SusC/RagA family TonB-linked outer membrane protein, partial [Prevotella sp.]|nr:SusC/RagA family TonB-linked outer membrane protein [Prevotella sp.]
MNGRMLTLPLLSIALAGIPATRMLATENQMSFAHVEQQQDIKVSGLVSDADGAVIGASVVEKGVKGNGTVSDLDGNFTLNVKPGATLVISYIGYKTVEIKATPGKKLNVRMEQESGSLNEVVVV